MVPFIWLIDDSLKPHKWYERQSVWLLIFVVISILTAFAMHELKDEDYIRANGTIYNWKYYTCENGVLYRRGRSYTLMVDTAGLPERCRVIKMTNGEFSRL